jgi:hypothetical protein
MTVVIVLALGILITPTLARQIILNALEELASGVTQASRESLLVAIVFAVALVVTVVDGLHVHG